jgi:hypothetical protein
LLHELLKMGLTVAVPAVLKKLIEEALEAAGLAEPQ